MTEDPVRATARSILFVDDEPAILDGLRNVLRPDRKRWQLRFAVGPEAALEAMAAAPADVVVTDMRMPGMDGLALLRHIQAKWPDAARIVLSGYADQAAVISASSVAHQYLLKPCDVDVLRRVLERSLDLLGLFQSPALRRAAGSLGAIPSMPRVYAELTRALEDPDVDMKRLARIFEGDPGMATRALQFVNSAYYGLARRVESIEAALIYIGINTLRHLAMTLQVFRSFGTSIPLAKLEGFERHAALVARIARRLVPDQVQGEAVFAAGLLHDAGRVALMDRSPTQYARAEDLAATNGLPLYEAEQAVYGANHAELGAYLLGLWGIPHSIVEAVAFHHDEARLSRGVTDGVLAVGAANLLAHACAGELHPQEESRLARLAGNRMAQWQEIAAEVNSSGGSRRKSS